LFTITRIVCMQKRAFTLIELLIVIAIVAILATATFVALDPLIRFKDARDTRRRTDIAAIMSAVKINQVDNRGAFLPAIGALAVDSVNMIGTDSSACDSFNAFCDTAVTSSASCADLSEFTTRGYLGSVPVSPNGGGGWSVGHTGYTIQRSSVGIITIRACESENSDEILISQ